MLGSLVQREQSVWVYVNRFSSLSCFRNPQGSLEDLNTQTAEDEEGNEEERSSVLSEGIDHGNILAYLSGSSSTSIQREWTPERSVL